MQSGDVVAGRFLLKQLAGSGGMAAVFQADDLLTQQPVALKVAYGKSLDEPRRFAREAELLASLSSDRIVAYVSHGVERGFFYLALEWLEGEDLDARLEYEGLTVADSLSVVAQTAKALAVVHERGLVHRDVKPGNLFLVDRKLDQIKLLDFGIARTAVLSPDMTRTGHLLGTPMYMAPEQASGDHELTPAVDIYALGCVLYECLTGQLPHDGQSLMELFARVLATPAAAPSTHRADIPPEVDELVLQMLAKRPADRIGSATEAAERLSGLHDLLLEMSSAPRSLGPTRVAEPLMLQERRLVSVLVVQPPAQSRAPGGHTVRMDDLAGWLPVDKLNEIVAAHGARAERVAGVGLVIIPDSHGDPVARSARCALAMREALPQAHYGLATQRAIMTGGWPFGEAIELAIQLAAQADDAVLIDHTTARLLDARFLVSESGKHAHRLESFSSRTDSTMSMSTVPMVGRKREIDSLRGALDDVAEARTPQAVVLTGAAGMGKSRVAREMVHRVLRGERRVLVAVARADPMAAGSPYGIAAQALRSVLGIDEGDGAARRKLALARRSTMLGLSGDDKSRLETNLELLLDVAGEHAHADELSQTMPLRRDPRVIADAIRNAFTRWLAAEAQRVDAILVLIEDLQWGDLPSVRLFDHAMGDLHGTPLLLVALARPEVRETFPKLWADRDVQSLKLRALTPEESRMLVGSILGENASAQLVSRLVAQGEGNAFYLEELARAAREGREEVPESVLALAQARLDRLAPQARRLLRAASVFGDVFWMSGVLALLGDWHAAEMVDWLTQLQQQQVIVQRRGFDLEGSPGLAFRHEILREAAYAALASDDRALAHLLAATWLEKHREADAKALAEQWRRSSRPERAISWYERAALRALEGHDFSGALQCVEAGLGCGATGEARGRLHLIAAEAHEWSTDSVARESQALAALAEFELGSNDWFEAFHHALQAGSRRLGLKAVAALCDTLDTLPDDREVTEAEVIALARTAGQLVVVSGLERARVILERAEQRAKLLPRLPPRVDGWLEWARAWRALAAGDVLGAYERDLASAECFEAAGDVRNTAYARSNVGYEQMRLGLLEEAKASLATAHATAERLGLSMIAANSLHNLGLAHALLGDLDAGREAEQASIALFGSQGLARTQSGAYDYLARIELMAGNHDVALAAAHQAVESGHAFVSSVCLSNATLARVLLAKGSLSEALALAAASHATLAEEGHADAEGAYIRVAYLDVLVACGDLDTARDVTRVAKSRVEEEASKLRDPRVRDAFMRLPEHRRITELAAELGVD